MATTTCEIEVHAPPEVIWAVVWDVERYPEFISDCVDAGVEPMENHDEGARQQRIEMRVQLIRPLAYTALMTGQPPLHVRWKATSTGGYLTSHRGSWDIDPSTDRRTCTVRYMLEVHFQLPIPDAVIRRFADLNLPTMMRQVKARSELVARRQEMALP